MKMTCEICGGSMKSRRLPECRDDDFLGLPGVVVEDSVVEYRCLGSGETAIEMPQLGELLAAVAAPRAQDSRKLTGDDVRFIRKVLGWSGKTLAGRLGVRGKTVSRWGHGRDVIGAISERILRLLALIELQERVPGVESDLRSVVSAEILPMPGRPKATRSKKLRLVRMKLCGGRKDSRAWGQAA